MWYNGSMGRVKYEAWLWEWSHGYCIAHRPLQSLCNELNGLFRSTHKVRYFFVSECDWGRLTRKTNGKSPSWAGVTWCMGWWRCWADCRLTTSLFHRQSVYRVQIVWSWMVVWPQGQRPWRQPRRTPLNSFRTPCTWWYRGIFSILCYILKNSLTEPESCIY